LNIGILYNAFLVMAYNYLMKIPGIKFIIGKPGNG
jgi:hypothetical protein